MSYKEWEDARRFEENLKLAQIEWEHKQAVAKADLKRAKKRLKEMKKSRPAMYRPDRPIDYTVEVVLMVRPFGLHVDRPFELTFRISGLMSETQAEVEAVRQAKNSGYIWRGTVSTKLVTQ